MAVRRLWVLAGLTLVATVATLIGCGASDSKSSTSAEARSAAADKWAERASQGGTGPCDFMTPTGKIAPKKVARAEKAIHAYEGALRSACEAAAVVWAAMRRTGVLPRRHIHPSFSSGRFTP